MTEKNNKKKIVVSLFASDSTSEISAAVHAYLPAPRAAYFPGEEFIKITGARFADKLGIKNYSNGSYKSGYLEIYFQIEKNRNNLEKVLTTLRECACIVPHIFAYMSGEMHDKQGYSHWSDFFDLEIK